jgi:ElaB/YqjD/DUF883 family membrane-anchored ribosome-binding protein
MERNTNDTFGSQNTGESTSGFSGGTGGGAAGAATSDTSSSRDTSGDQGGLADRAKNIAGSAGERLADVGSTVKERAGTLKNSLADALESSAEKLRKRSAAGAQVAGASGTGSSVGVIEDSRVAGATNQLAGGLQASADWLREADLDGLKSGMERQVKEHPGRTLAVAVGLGYLLGKAFRSK